MYNLDWKNQEQYTKKEIDKSLGGSAASGDLFKKNLLGGPTYGDSINVLGAEDRKEPSAEFRTDVDLFGNDPKDYNGVEKSPWGTKENGETKTQTSSSSRNRTNIKPYLKDWVAVNLRRKRKEKMNGGILRYPLEGLTDSTDYLQIDIKRYEPIGANFVNTPDSGARTVVGNRITNAAGSARPANLSRRALVNDGSILLPVPSEISTVNKVEYGQSEMNSLQAAGASGAINLMQDGFQNVVGNAQEAWRDLGNKVQKGVGSMEAGQEIFLSKLAAMGISVFGNNVSANDLISRSRGEIFNSNMELLFKGPALRSFRFNYKLTPRSHKESEQLLLILRAFKRNMSPKVFGSSNSGNWFLKTPNVFELRYRTGSRDHAFLNKFKQCFLTDCTVNYTPDAVYATYDDTTPVSMMLTLNFQEIVPIYDYDFDNGPGVSAIGY
jgi:hypothetical protein